jgi:integrase
MPAVAGPAIMDALIEAAKRRGRPRDLAIFLLLRFTGMRRGSVASLRVRHLDEGWGLRGVRVKGGKTQDIPLPSAVMAVLKLYVEHVLTPECEKVTPDTPLFWSTWGRRRVGRTRQPMAGKNIWRLCKTYGRLVGYPEPPAACAAPRRGRRGAGPAARPRGGPRAPRPRADRHDPDLHAHPAAVAQARGRLLRGAGAADPDAVNRA